MTSQMHSLISKFFALAIVVLLGAFVSGNAAAQARCTASASSYRNTDPHTVDGSRYSTITCPRSGYAIITETSTNDNFGRYCGDCLPILNADRVPFPGAPDGAESIELLIDSPNNYDPHNQLFYYSAGGHLYAARSELVSGGDTRANGVAQCNAVGGVREGNVNCEGNGCTGGYHNEGTTSAPNCVLIEAEHHQACYNESIETPIATTRTPESRNCRAAEDNESDIAACALIDPAGTDFGAGSFTAVRNGACAINDACTVSGEFLVLPEIVNDATSAVTGDCLTAAECRDDAGGVTDSTAGTCRLAVAASDCADNYQFNAATSSSIATCTACPINESSTGGSTCEACDVDTARPANGASCEACLEHHVRMAGEPSCRLADCNSATEIRAMSGACVACGTDQMPNDGNDACVCTDGHDNIGTAEAPNCVDECDANTEVRDGSSGMCECAPGYSGSAGACEPVPVAQCTIFDSQLPRDERVTVAFDPHEGAASCPFGEYRLTNPDLHRQDNGCGTCADLGGSCNPTFGDIQYTLPSAPGILFCGPPSQCDSVAAAGVEECDIIPPDVNCEADEVLVGDVCECRTVGELKLNGVGRCVAATGRPAAGLACRMATGNFVGFQPAHEGNPASCVPECAEGFQLNDQFFCDEITRADCELGQFVNEDFECEYATTGEECTMARQPVNAVYYGIDPGVANPASGGGSCVPFGGCGTGRTFTQRVDPTDSNRVIINRTCSTSPESCQTGEFVNENGMCAEATTGAQCLLARSDDGTGAVERAYNAFDPDMDMCVESCIALGKLIDPDTQSCRAPTTGRECMRVDSMNIGIENGTCVMECAPGSTLDAISLECSTCMDGMVLRDNGTCAEPATGLECFAAKNGEGIGFEDGRGCVSSCSEGMVFDATRTCISPRNGDECLTAVWPAGDIRNFYNVATMACVPSCPDGTIIASSSSNSPEYRNCREKTVRDCLPNEYLDDDGDTCRAPTSGMECRGVRTPVSSTALFEDGGDPADASNNRCVASEANCDGDRVEGDNLNCVDPTHAQCEDLGRDNMDTGYPEIFADGSVCRAPVSGPECALATTGAPGGARMALNDGRCIGSCPRGRTAEGHNGVCMPRVLNNCSTGQFLDENGECQTPDSGAECREVRRGEMSGETITDTTLVYESLAGSGADRCVASCVGDRTQNEEFTCQTLEHSDCAAIAADTTNNPDRSDDIFADPMTNMCRAATSGTECREIEGRESNFLEGNSCVANCSTDGAERIAPMDENFTCRFQAANDCQDGEYFVTDSAARDTGACRPPETGTECRERQSPTDTSMHVYEDGGDPSRLGVQNCALACQGTREATADNEFTCQPTGQAACPDGLFFPGGTSPQDCRTPVTASECREATLDEMPQLPFYNDDTEEGRMVGCVAECTGDGRVEENGACRDRVLGDCPAGQYLDASLICRNPTNGVQCREAHMPVSSDAVYEFGVCRTMAVGCNFDRQANAMFDCVDPTHAQCADIASMDTMRTGQILARGSMCVLPANAADCATATAHENPVRMLLNGQECVASCPQEEGDNGICRNRDLSDCTAGQFLDGAGECQTPDSGLDCRMERRGEMSGDTITDMTLVYESLAGTGADGCVASCTGDRRTDGTEFTCETLTQDQCRDQTDGRTFLPPNSNMCRAPASGSECNTVNPRRGIFDDPNVGTGGTGECVAACPAANGRWVTAQGDSCRDTEALDCQDGEFFVMGNRRCIEPRSGAECRARRGANAGSTEVFDSSGGETGAAACMASCSGVLQPNNDFTCVDPEQENCPDGLFYDGTECRAPASGIECRRATGGEANHVFFNGMCEDSCNEDFQVEDGNANCVNREVGNCGLLEYLDTATPGMRTCRDPQSGAECRSTMRRGVSAGSTEVFEDMDCADMCRGTRRPDNNFTCQPLSQMNCSDEEPPQYLAAEMCRAPASGSECKAATEDDMPFFDDPDGDGPMPGECLEACSEEGGRFAGPDDNGNCRETRATDCAADRYFDLDDNRCVAPRNAEECRMRQGDPTGDEFYDAEIAAADNLGCLESCPAGKTPDENNECIGTATCPGQVSDGSSGCRDAMNGDECQSANTGRFYHATDGCVDMCPDGTIDGTPANNFNCVPMTECTAQNQVSDGSGGCRDATNGVECQMAGTGQFYHATDGCVNMCPEGTLDGTPANNFNCAAPANGAECRMARGSMGMDQFYHNGNCVDMCPGGTLEGTNANNYNCADPTNGSECREAGGANQFYHATDGCVDMCPDDTIDGTAANNYNCISTAPTNGSECQAQSLGQFFHNGNCVATCPGGTLDGTDANNFDCAAPTNGSECRRANAPGQFYQDGECVASCPEGTEGNQANSFVCTGSVMAGDCSNSQKFIPDAAGSMTGTCAALVADDCRPIERFANGTCVLLTAEDCAAGRCPSELGTYENAYNGTGCEEAGWTWSMEQLDSGLGELCHIPVTLITVLSSAAQSAQQLENPGDTEEACVLRQQTGYAGGHPLCNDPSLFGSAGLPDGSSLNGIVTETTVTVTVTATDGSTRTAVSVSITTPAPAMRLGIARTQVTASNDYYAPGATPETIEAGTATSVAIYTATPPPASGGGGGGGGGGGAGIAIAGVGLGLLALWLFSSNYLPEGYFVDSRPVLTIIDENAGGMERIIGSQTEVSYDFWSATYSSRHSSRTDLLTESMRLSFDGGIPQGASEEDMLAEWDASIRFRAENGAWHEQTTRLGVSGVLPSDWMVIPSAATEWDAAISTRGEAGSLPYGGNARIGLSGPLWGASGEWTLSGGSAWGGSETYRPSRLRAGATLDLGKM